MNFSFGHATLSQSLELRPDFVPSATLVLQASDRLCRYETFRRRWPINSSWSDHPQGLCNWPKPRADSFRAAMRFSASCEFSEVWVGQASFPPVSAAFRLPWDFPSGEAGKGAVRRRRADGRSKTLGEDGQELL